MRENCNISSYCEIIRVRVVLKKTVVRDLLVANNSSFQNYPHLDDHTIQTTDTPEFKPLTTINVTFLIIL